MVKQKTRKFEGLVPVKGVEVQILSRAHGARSLVVKLLLVEQVSRVQFSPGTQLFFFEIFFNVIQPMGYFRHPFFYFFYRAGFYFYLLFCFFCQFFFSF